MKALAAFAILALAAAASSSPASAAEDFQPGSLRGAAERTLREEGAEAVYAQLDALLEDGVERVHARHVEAAETALDLLPPMRANALAARFLDEALTVNSGARDAWRLSLRLRDQLEAHLDAETGVPFFRRLSEFYPEQIDYQYYVADLLRDVGRAREARAEYERILSGAPGETRALFQVAWMDENLGDVKSAIARYDEIIALRPGDIDAYRAKAALQGGILRDSIGAERTALAGRAAAWTLEPGETRDYWIAKMSRELAVIRKEREQRERLQLADERLDRLLKIIALIWVAAFVLGLYGLRRAKLL